MTNRDNLFRHIAVVILVTMTSLAASAMGGRCGKGLRWELDNDGTLTITGSGPMDDYGRDKAPWRTNLVRYVSIADGVTHIGRNALAGSRIITAELPPSVKSIGDNAFNKCELLASITLPYGLEEIGRNAFEGCRILGKISIPPTVTVIGNSAFRNCRALPSLTLPARLKSLGNEVFKGCNAVTSITSLPDFVTATNCHIYGLPKSLVVEYLSGNQGRVSVAAVTAAPSAGASSAKKDKGSEEAAPATVYGSSDIDNDIPLRPQNNENTFAVVIANERYSTLANDLPSAPDRKSVV